MEPAEENKRKLNALKLSSFDWVKGLDDVWNLSRWDVPALHKRAEDEFSQEIVQLLSRGGLASPPGMIISGPGGAGKTHLLSRFCRIALLNRGYFLLADMSGEGGGFMETVLSGMARSLSTPVSLLEGRTQASVAAETILAVGGFQVPRDFPGRHTRANPLKLARDLEKLRDKLQSSWPREAAEHSECLRSVFLLNSRDALLRRAAGDWLSGRKLDPEGAAAAGFRSERGSPDRAVAGLSFCLSLGGRYSVLALDQMDHLSALFSLISRCAPGEGAQGPPASARAHVADFSDGLGRLTGLTRRTVAVVSCLPATWESLCALSLNTALERYRRPPIFLSPLGSAGTASKLVEARMKAPLRRAGLPAPHPGWPFAPGAFEDAVGLFPRALMERCHLLVRERVLAGDPSEIPSLSPPGVGAPVGYEDASSTSYAEDDLVEATPDKPAPAPSPGYPAPSRQSPTADPGGLSGPASDGDEGAAGSRGGAGGPGFPENFGNAGIPSPCPTPGGLEGAGPAAGDGSGQPPSVRGREPGDTMVFAWNDDESLRGYLESSVMADLEGLGSLEGLEPPPPAAGGSLPPAVNVGPPDPRGTPPPAPTEGAPGATHGEAVSPHGIYTWRDGEQKEPEEDPVFPTDRRFQELFRDADTEPFRDEELEDSVWPEALVGFLRAFAESRDGLGGPRVVVEGPPEGQDPPPYHAMALAEGGGLPERGRRLYVRALLRSNPKAFTSRIARALDAAKPDRRDPSARLVAVRFTPKPSGEVTAEAVDGFAARGGLWLRPSDADLSMLKAAGELEEELPRKDYVAWMRAFQPWRRLLFLAADMEWLSGDNF
ncbi:MAG: hypothetical protein LBQ12_01035 [Deltaproteobacteria bacterium]|jgi:hypothetical protein|nr:hypothetical protein [Deltaproteobacteria bacterium]